MNATGRCVSCGFSTCGRRTRHLNFAFSLIILARSTLGVPQPSARVLAVQQPFMRSSILLAFYRRYLRSGDLSRFTVSVHRRFSTPTLERLFSVGDIHAKRAAALAIGQVGDSNSIQFLGPFLRSSDRRLRTIVDDALHDIAVREGSIEQQHSLIDLLEANERGDYRNAYRLASQMLERYGDVAEVYHQRSLAAYQTDRINGAIRDCCTCLKLNSYHYGAMIGIGYCFLEKDIPRTAIYWLQRALEVFPDLEPVRARLTLLERMIGENGLDFDGSKFA